MARLSFFPTTNSAPPAHGMHTILPTSLMEQAVFELPPSQGKQRKLLPGIAAAKDIQPSKPV